MATNSPKNNSRKGAVRNRSQTKAPIGNPIKRDTKTGRFMDQKISNKKPFKGVRKESK
jgi:hypothetical protein